MNHNDGSLRSRAAAGVMLAPIHSCHEGTVLRVCIVVTKESAQEGNSFVLLRELPDARVYLGAVCDADARIQEWAEIWVQTNEIRELAFSSYQECLTNQVFDQRWCSEYEMYKANLPEAVIVTGMEEKNPSPILVKRLSGQTTPAFAAVEPAIWQLCKDDALLESFGLPLYSNSPFRFLHAAAAGEKTFLATAADAPANPHVQGIDRLKADPGVQEVFNPHAGLVRVMRFSPLNLEEYLQIIEGRAWEESGSRIPRFLQSDVYAELRAWSANRKGTAFLLHGLGSSADRLNEVFFLKLSALRNLFQEVKAYVEAQQVPLLNLSLSSFSVRLQNVGDQFPALWAAKCALVKPGQAHPLKIKATEQKYFIRLGRIEPSPFLPEGLGAHSFGIGSVRLRNVLSEKGGIVLEGTLVAEDYLGLDPHDLLWFKLPISEERLELYAHVYTSEAVGPKEARFRTVPTNLPEAVVARLKPGTSFAKSPYEVWPLLSSPCDLYSLGIAAIRILLANSRSNLPVIIDDILGLARHIGKDPAEEDQFLPKLKALLEREPKLLDLVSPHSMIELDWKPEQARSQILMEIWLEAIALLLRLFPGIGSQSYCKSFGDVSPLALETVFDGPLQELETLVLRLRSALVPTLSTNEEIASVLLQELANV